MAKALAFPLALELDNGIKYTFQTAIYPTGSETFTPVVVSRTIEPNFGLLEAGINDQIRDAIKDYCDEELGITISNSQIIHHQLVKPLL